MHEAEGKGTCVQEALNKNIHLSTTRVGNDTSAATSTSIHSDHDNVPNSRLEHVPPQGLGFIPEEAEVTEYNQYAYTEEEVSVGNLDVNISV